MKAIIINSELGKVSAVDHDGDWQSIHKWIGGNCRMFTTVRLYENNDTLFIDDEGLQNGTIQGFVHKNYDSPLMGNGILLGTDPQGESVDVKTSVDTVAKDISCYTALMNGTLFEFAKPTAWTEVRKFVLSAYNDEDASELTDDQVEEAIESVLFNNTMKEEIG